MGEIKKDIDETVPEEKDLVDVKETNVVSLNSKEEDKENNVVSINSQEEPGDENEKYKIPNYMLQFVNQKMDKIREVIMKEEENNNYGYMNINFSLKDKKAKLFFINYDTAKEWFSDEFINMMRSQRVIQICDDDKEDIYFLEYDFKEDETPDQKKSLLEQMIDESFENNSKNDKDIDDPVEDAPVEDVPVEDAPVEDAPVEDDPVEAAPVEDAPVEDAPVEAAPVEDAPVEDDPVEDAPDEGIPS